MRVFILALCELWVKGLDLALGQDVHRGFCLARSLLRSRLLLVVP